MGTVKMKNVVRLTLLASALIVLASCGGRKGADLQEGAVAPDKTLFENGMKFLGKKHFIKSRLSFQTLISTYPESEYTPTSFLSIADSYYEEGGKENLLQAEAQYKDFIIFYPTHESADNAQMRIAAINYRLMKPHDRDPTYTRKAEIELKKFLDDFPDSELARRRKRFLRQVREELARGVHGVGVFYHDREAIFRRSQPIRGGGGGVQRVQPARRELVPTGCFSGKSGPGRGSDGLLLPRGARV